MGRRFSLSLILLAAALPAAGALPSNVQLKPGAVNAVRVGAVAVYSDPGPQPARYVLLTHARRDVAAAGEAAVRRGSAAVIPEREQEYLTNPMSFWEKFETARFHDYAQPSTKVPARPIPAGRRVRGGETLDLEGLRFRVLDTPGFTPGAVSYILETQGKRVAFTGDLILEGGRLADLYSLQDAIPESKTRGYHGYAARAGALVASLRQIAEAKPDILVPARGKPIEDPQAAIDSLIRRLQSLMTSHFETDALLWYWGEESLRIRSRSVLDGKAVNSMPMARQERLPSWIVPIANSRLILSQSGEAFLVDGGYRDILKTLEQTRQQGKFRRLTGIWVTHYHDDHTDHVQSVSDHFGAPVYHTEAMTDILLHPSRYRMPCLTTSPIAGKPQPDGRKLQWNEFEMTFHYFPGQTLYHGGLHIRRNTDEIFFVGDSFTPSGIDDYCLHNRNFLREGEGYLYCLNVLNRYPKAWLINQHVEPMFQFDDSHYERMRRELRKRMQIIDELSPWPDRNFMIDESWARVYPYAQEVSPGEFTLELRVMNHSAAGQDFQVKWRPPAGIQLISEEKSVQIRAQSEGRATARFRPVRPGLHVVTVDLRFGKYELPEWTEAMVRVR